MDFKDSPQEANPTAAKYPRPQFRRDQWQSLDGPWRFHFDDERRCCLPRDVETWPLQIEVPFAPESKLSGIEDTGFHPSCWYQRDFEIEAPGEAKRVLLHFGAVDYVARVWVNDEYLGAHEGGHTPFSFDITPHLRAGAKQTVTVWAEDDPFDLAKPRGKQDWERHPHSIWYPRTTGIWQSVWLETVSKVFIDRLRWTPHLERWEIGCEAFVHGLPAGSRAGNLFLNVCLRVGEHVLVRDRYAVILGEVHRRIALSDPGIDDFRNRLLWSPEKPTLIEATVELWEGDVLLDRIESYTALRSVGVHRDRFMLNGRPYYLRLVLDQGYWTDSLMTAPHEDAFVHDIQLTKKMGFNGVRKHQKIEDPRYLYWADKLGLLVWEEMPAAYRFTHESVERIAREWTEVIDRDYSHPCIVTWVPFNESWGVPDLPEKPAHQHCVQALYHLTKTLDSTRPVIGNDGWESSATDIIGIHDYDESPARILERYGAGHGNLPELLGRRRPAGRVLTLDDHPFQGQPVVLTEFGGIAYVLKEGDVAPAHHAPVPSAGLQNAWGYSVSASADRYQEHLSQLLRAVHRIELFAGFCYTQLTDTFQEVNGLLRADREPKLPLAVIAAAVRGSGPAVRDDHENASSTALSLQAAVRSISGEA